MNIYKIARDGRIDFDEFAGFVIVAGSPSEARELAAESDTGCTGRWDPSTARLTTLGRYIGRRRRPYVVLSDFRAS